MMKLKGTKKYNHELVRKYQANKQVKFANENVEKKGEMWWNEDLSIYQANMANIQKKEKKGKK